jgi:N-hydroxyarylamine O-acetyltransferase
MLLRIDLDGASYIADVGFGSLTLTAPLRIEPNVEQNTPHGIFRLLLKESRYFLQAQVKSEWKTLYNFSLEEQQLLPDYEAMNWYVCTYPQSRFVINLIAARPASSCRYALFNNEFAVHHLDGLTERSLITEKGNLRATLEGPFQLPLEGIPGIDGALDRVIGRWKENQTRDCQPIVDSTTAP